MHEHFPLLFPAGLTQREQTKPQSSQFPPGRSLGKAYFLTCYLRTRLIISFNVGANWNPPSQETEKACGYLAFSPQFASTISSLQLLLGRSLSTYLAPLLLWLPPEIQISKSSSSESQQGSTFLNPA